MFLHLFLFIVRVYGTIILMYKRGATRTSGQEAYTSNHKHTNTHSLIILSHSTTPHIHSPHPLFKET